MPAPRPLLFAGLVTLLSLTGCVSTPEVALKPEQITFEQRQRQTHRFERVDEPTLLSASLAVLQDLGFTLDGSEGKLGVVTASRQLSGRRPLGAREVVRDLFWVTLVPVVGAPYLAFDAATGVKEPQIVRVSVVTLPGSPGESSGATARVTAQRLVYKDEQLKKLIKVEPLDDPAFYKEFFIRLGKSVALEEAKK
jgi:hypothetical protein